MSKRPHNHRMFFPLLQMHQLCLERKIRARDIIWYSPILFNESTRQVPILVCGLAKIIGCDLGNQFQITIFAISYFKTSNSINSVQMQFIDRVKEQRRLKEALSSDTPAFIVLFGRRRLGKSTLIRNVLNEKDVYYEASKNEQKKVRIRSHDHPHCIPNFCSQLKSS